MGDENSVAWRPPFASQKTDEGNGAGASGIDDLGPDVCMNNILRDLTTGHNPGTFWTWFKWASDVGGGDRIITGISACSIGSLSAETLLASRTTGGSAHCGSVYRRNPRGLSYGPDRFRSAASESFSRMTPSTGSSPPIPNSPGCGCFCLGCARIMLRVMQGFALAFYETLRRTGRKKLTRGQAPLGIFSRTQT